MLSLSTDDGSPQSGSLVDVIVREGARNGVLVGRGEAEA